MLDGAETAGGRVQLLLEGLGELLVGHFLTTRQLIPSCYLNFFNALNILILIVVWLLEAKKFAVSRTAISSFLFDKHKWVNCLIWVQKHGVWLRLEILDLEVWG